MALKVDKGMSLDLCINDWGIRLYKLPR